MYCGMLKKAVQQGRSEQRGDAYSIPYVEPLSETRTPLSDFFSILLEFEKVVEEIFPSPGQN
jgi:hypothetical protein